MLVLIGGITLGLAVLINFLFIVNKYKAGRLVDAAVDIAVMISASAIYGTSIMGGASATIGSMFISVYLHYNPLVPLKVESPTEPVRSNTQRDYEDYCNDYDKHNKTTTNNNKQTLAEKFDALFTQGNK